MDRVAVIADSHDHLGKIARATAVIREWRADLVLHAGDFVSPFTAAAFAGLGAPLEGVFGNNDGDRPALARAYRELGRISPDPLRLSFNGFSVLLTHKPRLAREAAAGGAHYHLIAFGHDHRVRVEQGDGLLICPGELGGWTTGRPSLALVQLSIGDVEIVYL